MVRNSYYMERTKKHEENVDYNKVYKQNQEKFEALKKIYEVDMIHNFLYTIGFNPFELGLE